MIAQETHTFTYRQAYDITRFTSYHDPGQPDLSIYLCIYGYVEEQFHFLFVTRFLSLPKDA